MEPTDLKSIPPDDARLEAWYHASVSTTPLPDDGFSRRVLAALPAPAHRAAAERRLFCLGGALLGSAVALIGVMSSKNIAPDLSALDGLFTQALTQLATPAVGWALALAAASVLFAFQRQLRLWLKL